ncbi:unnamed protein product, partial [Nesidiocoris tenuis]
MSRTCLGKSGNLAIASMIFQDFLQKEKKEKRRLKKEKKRRLLEEGGIVRKHKHKGSCRSHCK